MKKSAKFDDLVGNTRSVNSSLDNLNFFLNFPYSLCGAQNLELADGIKFYVSLPLSEGFVTRKWKKYESASARRLLEGIRLLYFWEHNKTEFWEFDFFFFKEKRGIQFEFFENENFTNARKIVRFCRNNLKFYSSSEAHAVLPPALAPQNSKCPRNILSSGVKTFYPRSTRKPRVNFFRILRSDDGSLGSHPFSSRSCGEIWKFPREFSAPLLIPEGFTIVSPIIILQGYAVDVESSRDVSTYVNRLYGWRIDLQ